MTVNEKKFIEAALPLKLRADGRHPLDYRRLTIKFGREDGSAEVQLGQTHVMAFATSQLVQPYRDRPNEGTLSIFAEFSPMGDPSFEAGRPGEAAIELGRVIDRGLRESRAVDMESLCVVAGKSVWAIRLDLHIIDNGGNLIDAANIAALASLLTFRRPDCTFGEHDQEVIVHDPEVREPIPLTIHHLPVAVTFAIFGDGKMAIDPTHKEEVVMCGRLTATVNSNGDVCAIQKAGGEGLISSDIMGCLRTAHEKSIYITSKIKKAVDAHNTERALRRVKRHSSSVAQESSIVDIVMKEKQADDYTRQQAHQLGDGSDGKGFGHKAETVSSHGSESRKSNAEVFIGGPSNWDPYSKGGSSSLIASFQASPGPLTLNKETKGNDVQMLTEPHPEEREGLIASPAGPVEVTDIIQQKDFPKSLKDAVKPKSRKKQRAPSTSDGT